VLEIDLPKIDGQFVRDLRTTPVDRAPARAITNAQDGAVPAAQVTT
jgi:EAL domain-containing protein (putative c-di-GMP-specific phosphodiesterase class I)